MRASGRAPGAGRSVRPDPAWLSLGSAPGKGTRWEDMVRTALLDLHQLSQPGGSVAAGAGDRWNYAWPRDTAFVAVAMARTGHYAEALQELEFLQRVQPAKPPNRPEFPGNSVVSAHGGAVALWPQ
jgi:hypothetical protein